MSFNAHTFNHAKMLRLSFAKGNKHTNKTKYIKILENRMSKQTYICLCDQ